MGIFCYTVGANLVFALDCLNGKNNLAIRKEHSLGSIPRLS